MKKLTLTLIALVAMLAAMAQTPNAFNYQTAVRDADGSIIADQSVAFQISILQGAADGTAVYVETHAATTNTHGLVNFQIGGGTTTDDFSTIDWAAGPYFIKVEMDAAGGTTFVEMGTTQLISVPFAKHADAAEFANNANTAVTAGSATIADEATTAEEASHALNADTANYAEYAALAETTADMTALLDRIAALEEMSGIGTITDIDGNEYEITKIGNQIWMAENLRVTRYADGTPIPQVTNNTEWQNLGNDDKAFCWWENDSATYAESYGAYYTFAAANNGNVTSDSAYSTIQGVCPDGWHMPSQGEWNELRNYLGSVGHAGNEGTVLKSTTGWDADGNGTDLYGFNTHPYGLRDHESGGFQFQGVAELFYSSNENENSIGGAWMFIFENDSNEIMKGNDSKQRGSHIRCVKNQ